MLTTIRIGIDKLLYKSDRASKFVVMFEISIKSTQVDKLYNPAQVNPPFDDI